MFPQEPAITVLRLPTRTDTYYYSKSINRFVGDPPSFFLRPRDALQRRYEALRAIFVDGDELEAVARRFGYEVASLRVLCSRFRNGDLDVFPAGVGPGRPAKPPSEALRDAVLDLRRQNLDMIEIARALPKRGLRASPQTVYLILRDAGVPRLPRRTRQERTETKPVAPEPPTIADVGELDLTAGRTMECRAPLLFLFAPLLARVGVDALAGAFPGTRMLPAAPSLRSLLALKLLSRPRKNHAAVLGDDAGYGAFAGLNVLPKTTSLSTYSYRVGPKPIRGFLEAWVRGYGKVDAWPGDSFNLDFHAIRHHGEEAVLEKNYVPRRSQRVKSVLTVFAQEHASTSLVYADANLLKRDQADQVVKFVEYWERVSGRRPRELVFDSKGTTHEGLAKLENLKVKFLTLRERRPKEIARVQAVPTSRWTRVTLEAPDRAYRHPRILDERVRVSGYPKRIRQVTAVDLGRPDPTFLLTNDMKSAPATLLLRYAKRAILENSIGEQVAFFHVDALSSDVRLKVDLDVTLSVIASNCYHWLARRLKGFESRTAATLWRTFLDRPGSIRIEKDAVVLRVRRFARAPTLIESQILDDPTPIPWLGGRRLKLELL